ncbi:4-coumarate-CoA ligase 2 [Patellaria atrata CBS 101060]|uniref:4-coumarate-CoA ligase 2 n=1 Tax=Patellaria atrata CBS 101060 TaxID=1346257 RepID=A0A9P4S8X2_9PEZI|nr:4-coumarate-CoA ligase 2 [Patellaria atrata CBS 101060]
MPIKAHLQVPIPQVPLPTYLFTSPSAPLSDKPTFIDVDRPETHYLTKRTYRQWSKRIAAGLQATGLKPGDRVLLFSGNTLFFPCVIMGVIMAGGIFTGANPSYVARELAYQLQDSGARFLIAAEGSFDTAIEAARIAGLKDEQIFTFDDGQATFDGTGKDRGSIRHWSKLVASPELGDRLVWEELGTEEEANRTIALNYSSGTTGMAKGVEITHRNYIANIEQVFFMMKGDPEYQSKTTRARWLCFLPLYHAYAQTVFTVLAPIREVQVYLMQKFDFLQMLQIVEKFRITDLWLVPPIVVAMVKHPATKKFDLSSVERAASGAAPLGKEICMGFEKLWDGRVNIKQGWGMTELTCAATGWKSNAISTSASVGQVNPNCEIKIVRDERGLEEVKHGERGELWVRGPVVMKGYWNKPAATKETLVDGWLRTGDIGFVDKDGFFYIVDRMKELIKVKGNQVAPAELEALLLDHPAIADVAVIGVEMDGDEAPRAYVVLKEGKTTTADDIVTFLDSKVSKHKRLKAGARFVNAIPKNPSGKILRKILRDQAKAETQKVALAAKL